MTVALYKKIDGAVVTQVFADDTAAEAMKDGWVDNPTDADAPKKRGRLVKDKDDGVE